MFKYLVIGTFAVSATLIGLMAYDVYQIASASEDIWMHHCAGIC